MHGQPTLKFEINVVNPKTKFGKNQASVLSGVGDEINRDRRNDGFSS